MRHAKLLHGAIALPLLFATSSAFSSAAGQAESVALDSLTRSYVLSTDSRDAEFAEQGIAKEESRSVGLDIVSSDNVDLYSVPLSYGIPMSVLGEEEFLNVGADIPYFSAEDPAGGENGLGDISLGAEYFVEQNDMIVKLGVDLKLATGDEEKSLGTDSTDIGVSLTGRKRDGMLGYNATAAYVIRGEGTVFGVKRDYGNMISLSGGGEYKLAYGLWLMVSGLVPMPLMYVPAPRISMVSKPMVCRPSI